MKWSYRIARVSGIDVRVHATFVLIVLLGAFEWGAAHGVPGALFGALVVCTLFVCVALHELGHSLVAQRFGVGVREIVLLPIGGLARLAREPEKPMHELLIAVAGPLVNVLIAVALSALALLTFGPGALFGGILVDSVMRGPSVVALLSVLLFANVALAVFNMIPALPMDGGRVFRALLALVLGKSRATHIAAAVGQLLAVALAVWGITNGNPILALIGAFVFLGAGQERMMARASELLSSLRAAEVCDPTAPMLSPGDVLDVAVGHLFRGPHAQLPVVYGDRLVGVLGRADALRAARRGMGGAFVGAFMRKDFDEIAGDTPLEQVRMRLIETGGRPIVVRYGEGYAGLLGFDDLARVTQLAASLQRRRRPGLVRPSG